MKLFDFSNKNYGIPFSANTFEFIQQQMLQLQTLSYFGGSLFVVQGCTNLAGIVQDGWVVINGEILPFVGGAVQPFVVIQQTTNTASFGDPATGATPQIYPYSFDRIATFGTGATQYDWALFENKDLTKGVLQRLREVEGNADSLRADLTTLNAAFNAYQPAWADITGKPSGTITYSGRKVLNFSGFSAGDVKYGIGGEITIDIPDQGNNNYRVIGSLVYLSGGDNNANTFCVVSDFKSATQFKIWVREWENATQNLAFDFIIIKL
jgi:hypothetical protein